MKKLAILFLVIFLTSFVHGQKPDMQQTIEDLLESVGEELSDDSDIQEILDDLEYLMQNPLNINRATADDLIQLHFLSGVQINNLISYREKSGQIYSLYEMASIDGFSMDILQKIEPFISFNEERMSFQIKKTSGNLFLRGTRSFSNPHDENESKNEGTLERYYIRLKQTTSNLEYGLVAEKDPGEAIFSQSNKHGFDYKSAFMNFKIGRKDNRIFIGDYHVRFGQGLVVWQGFSMGKSSETTQVFRTAQGISSYSSTDENFFFRGIAGQFKYRQFAFQPFVSLNKMDANVDTLDEKPYFGAFQTSGYHRTSSEISGEDALSQFSGGANFSFSYNNWSFGLTSVYNRFNVEIMRSDELYNQFLPNGKENMVTGFDWKGSVKKVFLFGEAAIGRANGKAFLTGVMLKPASNMELSMVYRNINRTYFSYFSNAFTESSKVNDENAFYVGTKIFPASRWIIWAYADFFSHKWLKYLTAAPSNGTEFFAQLAFNQSKETKYYLRFYQEDKAQKLISEGFKYNEQQLINRLRFNYSHELNDQFSLKSRIEMSWYSKRISEKGVLICQDLVFMPPEKSFSMNGRLAYFHTDGYNSRLYAYENDVLYSFSIPALYGKGIRTYMNFQKNISNSLTFWLKLASTYKFTQSDGEQDIDSSSKTEIRVQLRYQF
jgi:hypothetical protein